MIYDIYDTVYMYCICVSVMCSCLATVCAGQVRWSGGLAYVSIAESLL
jgi:hypothetical protein